MPSLESFFRVREAGSTPRREALAGLTTFLAMAYIIFVNPAILSQAGMDFGAVFTATCLSAAIATLVMGIAANYPIALAPGMGQNVFFLTVVLGMGVAWQQALTAYVESATGVEAGGRTGLANVATAACFLAALFVEPLVRMVAVGIPVDGTTLYPVTAPALLLVGVLMSRGVTRIDWADLTEALPAFLVMTGIPFTYSIADGLAMGFVSYPAIKLLAGASELTLLECDRVLLRAVVKGRLKEAQAAERQGILGQAASHWSVLALSPEVFERARRPFPHEPVRTLDALQLASALSARALVPDLVLLSLDDRLRRSGRALGFRLVPDQGGVWSVGEPSSRRKDRTARRPADGRARRTRQRAASK